MSQIKVVGLFQYPVKGMRGNSLAIAPVDTAGLAGDRRLMLVDPEGNFITQRECPKLATMAARYEALYGPEHLVFSALGFEQDPHGDHHALDIVSAPYLANRDEPVIVKVWKDTVRAYRVDRRPDGIEATLSRVLGQPVRLVHLRSEVSRLVRHQPPGAIWPVYNGFADAYPFLLTSVESLLDLNGRLAEPLPMDRFRPNIVVAGGEAFEEEDWQEFNIGNVRFAGMKRCGRCVVTTTDQATGERMGKEPLATLSRYRRFGKDACFGMNLAHLNTGDIRVGDEVVVLRRGPPFVDNKNE